jgi:NAD(P)-dependent dehydrogenase (short-subunit alcohol dehydrogenase family)
MTSVKQAFDLSGKTALITGGSRGLGLQMAEALGEQGAHIVLSSRKADELEKARQHLSAMDIKSDWIAADGQKAEDVERLARDAISKTGRIDILVNNAGATWGAPTTDHSLEAWDKLMNLNVRSVFYLSQQIGKLSMIPNGGGKILNITSTAGLRGNHPDSIATLAYNASKAAVVNMTRALASEWGKYGINVNALAPGYFLSNMTKGVIESVGLKKMTADVPLRRIGDGDDLKGAALLFCSPAGKHITGQILAVDGGIMAM